MLDFLRKRVDEDEQGFTLIELLVVVIIIGILAAIAIPTFLSQRERGWQAELTSTLRNVALEVEAAATAQGGSYVGLDANVTAVDGYAETIQGAIADPVVFVAAAADFTATGFCLAAGHVRLDDTSPPATMQVYDSALGGLQDFNQAGASC